jgi:alpha-ketoglutarate-dependent taurine dioxygenase
MASALAAEIDQRQAWTRMAVAPPDWLIKVPDACVVELEVALRRWRSSRPPVEALEAAAFDLSATAALMARVRTALAGQVGMAVLDRLPVERYSAEEGRVVGWLVASLLGPLVAQTWDGARVYDVRDTGKPLGPGVRRSVTNLGQPFHTDGGWLPLTPGFVGLFCLESAEEGGLSRLVSLVTAHERLRAQQPDLLDRLYRAFWWDRQAEHAPGDPPVSARPVFEVDRDGLVGRYYEDYVVKGQRLAGEPLDPDGVAALAAMREIIDDPANWVELRVEKGQFQYLNNRRFAHSRTGFADGPGARHRHMLRFWNRDEGTSLLEGA